MSRKFTVLLVLAISATAAMAEPFEDASAAYRRGDYAHALTLWQSVAATNAEAQNDIGLLYLDGKGAAQDNAQALHWIARAATNGSAAAQNNLGAFYRDGKIVPRDFDKAFTFFTAAAAQGNVDGQHNLGLMYAMGQGTRVDNVRAYMWFDLAAIKGLKSAAADRDTARARLTAANLAAAKTMEQGCRISAFKACG